MQNRLKVWSKRNTFLFFLILCIISIACIIGIKKILTPMRTIDLLTCNKSLEKWTDTDHLEHYVGNELVEYINGGAELYFAYGFKQAYVKEYRNDSGRNIIVEVYEMDKSENAYGVYSFDTDGEHLDIGFEATYAYGLLKFWKDRFFVRIISESEDETTRNAILFYGKQIADKIHKRGVKPGILSYVPTGRPSVKDLRYFHTNACLSNFYYLSDDNILGLNKDTEAVTYEYMVDNQLLRVVLIQYSLSEYAKKFYQTFIKSYFFDKSIQDSDLHGTAGYIERVEEGKYTGIRISARFLIIVFEAENRESCEDVLNLQAIQL